MTTQKTSKKNTIIMVSIIVVLLAVIGVMAYLLLYKPKEEPLPNVVTEKNKNEIMEQLQKKVEDGTFEMAMTTYWTFENSSAVSTDAVVENAASNRYSFYFTVTLKDTEEVVYTSETIPVGSQLTAIKLEKDVPAGTHPASLQYHLLNESGGEHSSVGVAITLNVLN